jgi:hypothetical protein
VPVPAVYVCGTYVVRYVRKIINVFESNRLQQSLVHRKLFDTAMVDHTVAGLLGGDVSVPLPVAVDWAVALSSWKTMAYLYE